MLFRPAGESSIVPINPKQSIRPLPVKGGLSVREAAERITADPDLFTSQMPLSGALLIEVRRKQQELTPSTTPSEAEYQEAELIPTVKKSTALSVVAGVLVAFAPEAACQTGPTAAAREKEQEIISLSPFTVQASGEVGYRATSTLAGSKLNTPLRDLGAPISVLTSELLRDLGATDAGTAFLFATNMEVAGVHGNFTGGSIQGASYNTSAVRREPQNEGQRVRGLGRASLTRGFFLTDIPFDSYNIERVTISRGPNSLLFGIGEVGGVVDHEVKQAGLERTRGEAGVRFGARGSRRDTAEYNLVLAPQRLALLVSAVNDLHEHEQRPAFTEDRRMYAALQAVLRPGNRGAALGRTTLRANIEHGRISANPPNVVPPTDGITPWFSLPSYTTGEVAALNDGQVPVTARWISNGNFRPKLIIDNRTGQYIATTLPNSGRQPLFFNFGLIYPDPFATGPSLGQSNRAIQGTIGRVQWNLLSPRIPPYNAQVDMLTLQPFEPIYMPGYVGSVIQNRRVLDNTRMLITGTTGRVEHSFGARNIVLEQELFGGAAGIQIAYDRQRYANSAQLLYDSGESNILSVDINAYTPNLEPNPHVGRVFMVTNGNEGDLDVARRYSTREATQATVFYRLDLTTSEGWRRHLGRHAFTGFAGQQEITRGAETLQPNWVDAPGSGTDVAAIVNHGINSGRRRVYLINYLTPSLTGSQYQSLADVRIDQYVRNPLPRDGQQFLIQYSRNFGRPTLNPATGLPFFNDPFQVKYAYSGGDRSLQRISSRVASWQANLLRNHLVGMIGWRRDYSKTFGSRGGVYLPSGEWDPANLAIDPTNRADTSGDTLTKSLVARVPRQWTERLGSDLSLHGSESGNFAAIPARNDIRRQPIGNPTGKTRDLGFSLERGELSLRVSRFETESTNASLGLGATTALAGNVISTMLVRAYENAQSLTIQQYLAALGQPTGAAGRFASWDELYREILSLSLANSHGNRYSLTPTTFGAWLTPVDRATATSSARTRGWEIEITGNVTPRWRLAINAARQETVQFDTAALLGEVAFKLRDELAASKLNGLKDSVTRSEIDTYQTRFTRTILNPLLATLAKDGTTSAEQRKWRFNFVSTYQFHGPWLKGASAGIGLRWQDRAAIGYRIKNVVEGAVTPDVTRPIFGDPEWNGDVWLGYRRRLLGRFDWRVQLNVRNALGTRDYIPVIANPDGRIVVVRNPPPREILLGNTFGF
jgi:outer membrane receptor protein involved in Fe transport